MANPVHPAGKPANPDVAKSIRDLSVLRRNTTMQPNTASTGMTINPLAIRMQQQRVESSVDRAANGNRAEVAENAIAGLEAMSGAGAAGAMSAIGLAAPLLGALDMISTPITVESSSSMALSPEDQLDPATSMIPR